MTLVHRLNISRRSSNDVRCKAEKGKYVYRGAHDIASLVVLARDTGGLRPSGLSTLCIKAIST